MGVKTDREDEYIDKRQDGTVRQSNTELRSIDREQSPFKLRCTYTSGLGIAMVTPLRVPLVAPMNLTGKF